MSGRLFISILISLLAPAAWATTLQHQDTRALTRGSQQIVIGTVEKVAPRWDERRTTILTDVTLRVSRSLKGAAVERLVLTQLGGEVDGVRVSVHGAPVFVPGQESLVFVWRDRAGRAQVNGLAQGKFDISVAPHGERWVQRMVPGFAVSDARTLARASDSATAPTIALEEMEAEIIRALAEEGQ